MSGEPETDQVAMPAADRFAGVIREPERPRGRPMISPVLARGIAAAGAGTAALVAVAFALLIFFDVSEYGVTFERTVSLVTFLMCATGVSIAISASQRLSAATGLRRTSRYIAGLGLITVLLWGLFSIVIDVDRPSPGADIVVASLAASGSLVWIAATIGVVQVGAATLSTGLRRYRQVTSGMFAIAAACLVSAIWLAMLGELVRSPGRGAGAVAGILAVIGFWVGFLAMLMSVLGQTVARRMAGARAKSSATVDSSTTVRFACPGCTTAQESGRGVHRCANCGTRVAIQIDEPRCRCGYTLFRLSADRCPECGLFIEDADRYRAERFNAPPETGTTDARPAAQPLPSPAETESVTSVEPPASD